MRVAMVVQRFRPHIGGAELQIERLAPRLAARGVEVSVVTRRLPDTAARERLDGLDVIRVRVPAAESAASVAYTCGAVAALARIRPDVIHVHGLLSPATIGLIGGAVLRVPVVAKVLSSGPCGSLRRLLNKPFSEARLRAIGRRVDAVITVAEESERELLEQGVPAHLLVRIPNGVDATAFRPPGPGEKERLRAVLDIPDGPLALYCGRLERPKRVPELIEAFAAAGAGHLLVVGDGSEHERARALAASPALQGRVIVRPAVEHTAPLYRAADLYLSASVREGMSGSVLEAMASGLCVGAAPAGGMVELLADGAGMLLPADGTAGLATGIRELVLHADHRARLGAAARARVESQYSLDRTADRLVALYRRLMTDGAAG